MKSDNVVINIESFDLCHVNSFITHYLIHMLLLNVVGKRVPPKRLTMKPDDFNYFFLMSI